MTTSMLFKKEKTVYRAYFDGKMVPICQHCDNSKECDFKKSDLMGCDSFSKITVMRLLR